MMAAASKNTLKLPDGLLSRALLPELGKIQRDTLGFLLDCTHRFGDLVYFEAGRNRAFFVNHPDAIKYILQTNNRNYSKDTIQYRALSTITGCGLLTSDGDFWFRQRRLEQPAFSRPRIMAMDKIVVPVCEKMLNHWESIAADGGSVDVDREMMRLTLEIVGKALFSIDLSGSAEELTRAVLTTLDHIVHRARNPIGFPDWFPTPANLRFQAALSTLDMHVYNMISGRQRIADPGEDMLGMLLKAKDPETDEPMTERQVRDEVITLLIAGHETVASALTWTWKLLAGHPSVTQRIETEVDSVLNGRYPSSLDLENLPYVSQVFSEALRLYPPAWLITRKALNDDQIDGYDVPLGSLIIMSPYVMHRNPKYWDAPEQFQPERFEPDQEIKQTRYAYIPFGGGPRLCIGSQFAMVEAQLIISMIVQRFHLEQVGNEPKVDALVTLRPRGGLHMRPHRR